MAVRKAEFNEVKEVDKVLLQIQKNGSYKSGDYGFTDSIVEGYLLRNEYVRRKKIR